MGKNNLEGDRGEREGGKLWGILGFEFVFLFFFKLMYRLCDKWERGSSICKTQERF